MDAGHGPPLRAATEAMFTMCPLPCFRMMVSRRQHRNVPFMFTLTIRSHSSRWSPPSEGASRSPRC